MSSESRVEIDRVIKGISSIVSSLSGIQLGPKQHSMVESRLKGRMAKLKLSRFADYDQYLNENLQEESQALLSLLTTHHTFFFREFNHFEYMLNHSLPSLIEKARKRGDRKIRIWSAAASRGQEAYSLAMFMKFHLSASAPDVDFEIWGTDVDPDSIRMAKNGVYKSTELKQAPSMYVTGNWIAGKGTAMGFYKVREELRHKCQFATANLLKSEDFLKDKEFDIIFCRNVYIYFNAQQIEQCTASFLKHLDKDGFLFLGVSESLNGLKLPVEAFGSSIYRHEASRRTPGLVQAPPRAVAQEAEKVYRVLSVDDSPAILGLMKKIIGSNSSFKHVGTASNGLEALEFMKKNQVDLITLDLHMPEMDGLQFLASDRDKKIPVLIVSSINREDTSIAQKALALGAADYVEKPSLENIGQATNEICSKLKSIAKAAKTTSSSKSVSTGTKKKKVLIVDDSATIRQLLEKIISKDPDLEVVGKAEKPSQVEAMIKSLKPDVITLDIHMPEMDGITLLKRIHPLYRIPTVMISSISREEGPQVLNALEIGAIDYIQKPEMSSLGAVEALIREKIKAAAYAKTQGRVSVRKARSAVAKLTNKDLVLLGASTGGTEAIKSVLESMPAQIPPILIVQHIPAGFSAAFANRLNDLFPFEVREAAHGDVVKANRVLIAPGGKQMKIAHRGAELFVEIRDEAPVNRHKPSVDYLFSSAAQLGLNNAVVVLMTGMGADGAREMKTLKDIGCTTIAQDQASCVVYGMPREAIEMGAATLVKSLSEIGATIMEQVGKNSSAEGKKSA